MKLHVKADSVTPAFLTRWCVSYGLTDGMAPRFRPGFASLKRSFASHREGISEQNPDQSEIEKDDYENGTAKCQRKKLV